MYILKKSSIFEKWKLASTEIVLIKRKMRIGRKVHKLEE